MENKTAAEIKENNLRRNTGAGAVITAPPPIAREDDPKPDKNRQKRVRQVDGNDVVYNSWIDSMSPVSLVDKEVVYMNEKLNLSATHMKAPHPKYPNQQIPVWLDGFKCDHCDEEFIHLTPDFITEEAIKKGVVAYREHLSEHHVDEIAKRLSINVNRQGDDTAHIMTLENENKSLKDEIAKLSAAVDTMLKDREAEQKGKPSKVKK